MSPQKNGRFDYAKAQREVPESLFSPMEPVAVTDTPRHTPVVSPALTTVARGRGRMQQDREQLNVRLPTQLKRRAAAAAALNGQTIGELIEQLLLGHLDKSSQQ